MIIVWMLMLQFIQINKIEKIVSEKLFASEWHTYIHFMSL